jgi:hypothetical protein
MTIGQITPILARTVIGIAALTTLLSVVAVVTVGAAQLLLFTGFSMIAGLYAHQVLHGEDAPAQAGVAKTDRATLAA